VARVPTERCMTDLLSSSGPAMSVFIRSFIHSHVQLHHWAESRREREMGPWRRPSLYPVAATTKAHGNAIFKPKIAQTVTAIETLADIAISFFLQKKEHEKKNSADSFQFVSPACIVADWEWRVAQDDKNVSCSNARISRGLHDRPESPSSCLPRDSIPFNVWLCVCVFFYLLIHKCSSRLARGTRTPRPLSCPYKRTELLKLGAVLSCTLKKRKRNLLTIKSSTTSTVVLHHY
jgi:hypothetical protein